MKEFGLEKIIFVCTDSTEIFFSKLRSAGLNYNILSFFTDSYCAGVSNKHCLLTFSIFTSKAFCKHVSHICMFAWVLSIRHLEVFVHGLNPLS